jgi:hypothetical protein
MTTDQPGVPVLDLVAEAKIHEVLGDPAEKRLEASGVCIKDGLFYVTFDNSSRVARIAPELEAQGAGNRMFETGSQSTGYEDIAYDPRVDRFYVLIEALEVGPGRYKARVEDLDSDLRYLSGAFADFALTRANKGLEGLSCAYRDGKPYLLGLCEGNKCKGGALGRVPGKGRVQIFERGEEEWTHLSRIKLPRSLPFEDYASLDVDGERVAVVSQASSLLWVGAFRPGSWEIADKGRVYQFPKSRKGNTRYCNIEGVAWLGAERIVVVSDKAKPDEQAKRCRKKDQSIHVFAIPA